MSSDVQFVAYRESIVLGPNLQSDTAPYTETGKRPLFAFCEDTQEKEGKVVWKGLPCVKMCRRQEHRRISADLKQTCAGNISRTVSGCRGFGSKAGEELVWVVSPAVVSRSPKHRAVLVQEQGRK